MGSADFRWTRIGPVKTRPLGHRVGVHANFVVIPASAPGSIAGQGKWPPRQMDPGPSDQVKGLAGMTTGLVTPVEGPTQVMSDLNRTPVAQAGIHLPGRPFLLTCNGSRRGGRDDNEIGMDTDLMPERTNLHGADPCPSKIRASHSRVSIGITGRTPNLNRTAVGLTRVSRDPRKSLFSATYWMPGLGREAHMGPGMRKRADKLNRTPVAHGRGDNGLVVCRRQEPSVFTHSAPAPPIWSGESSWTKWTPSTVTSVWLGQVRQNSR